MHGLDIRDKKDFDSYLVAVDAEEETGVWIVV
jgi:hypothetical protein